MCTSDFYFKKVKIVPTPCIMADRQRNPCDPYILGILLDRLIYLYSLG